MEPLQVSPQRFQRGKQHWPVMWGNQGTSRGDLQETDCAPGRETASRYLGTGLPSHLHFLLQAYGKTQWHIHWGKLVFWPCINGWRNRHSLHDYATCLHKCTLLFELTLIIYLPSKNTSNSLYHPLRLHKNISGDEMKHMSRSNWKSIFHGKAQTEIQPNLN